MGKAQLKKEIQALSREELEHLVLEAYEARKEIKQYFDFFLDPVFSLSGSHFRH